MLEQLLLNTRVHLRFFARNRLLLAFALVMLSFAALSMVPMVLYDTSANRFSLLQNVTGELTGFALVFTASLGLFALSSHLRARNVKMVLTKPCRPEVWLGSIFLAGALVGLVLHVGIAAVATILSVSWGIPLQPGIAFLAVDGFLRASIWLAVMTALTSALHPVIAVLVVMVVNEGVFYQLKFMLESAIAADGPGFWNTLARLACDTVYTLLPMTEPFSEKTEAVYGSWRTSAADWVVLAGSLGYAALVTMVLYLVALFVLRRRELT